jgi:hypothetical protein
MALLDDPWSWRRRLTDHVELASSRHARVRSAYQVELPADLVEPLLPPGPVTAVRALLPLTTRAKGLLLRASVTGPPWPGATVLRRADIAAYQAEYLARLVETGPAPTAFDAVPPGLFEAVCVFTPEVARRFLAEERGPAERVAAGVLRLAEAEGDWAGDATRRRALAAYLSDGLSFPVPAGLVDELLVPAGDAGRRIVARLDGEPADPFSSSENALLALPRLEPRPRSAAEVRAVVQAWAAAVAAADAAGDDVLLRLLGDYGRRFEVIVEAVVPLGRPSVVELAEDRPQRLGWRSTCRHRVNLGDAESYHLEMSAAGGAVDIGDVAVWSAGGAPVGIGLFEGARETPELWTVYTSDPDRPTYADVAVELKVPVASRWAWRTVVLVACSAVVAAVLVDPGPERLLAALGLLVVPTTFAVSLLVVREQTPLAARLHRWQRATLVALTSVLWAVTVIRMLRL